MFRTALMAGAAALAVAVTGTAPATAADFNVDPMHSSMVFMVNHLGYSNLFGRFTEFQGEFNFDPAKPLESKVKLVIKTDSVDTNERRLQAQGGVRGRDEHLRSADFFNTKDFPTMAFESTKVESADGKTGKLHGNFTMLGQTKQVVLDVTFNRMAPHPLPGYNKILTAGFSLRGTIKRSDWGMKTFVPALGDEITLYLEVEGAEKK